MSGNASYRPLRLRPWVRRGSPLFLFLALFDGIDWLAPRIAQFIERGIEGVRHAR